MLTFLAVAAVNSIHFNNSNSNSNNNNNNNNNNNTLLYSIINEIIMLTDQFVA
jgi:hypothetical protein